MRALPEYKLIPLSDVTEEARTIAVAWCENYQRMGFDIQQKHKLASDIMNYAAREVEQYKRKIEFMLTAKELEYSDDFLNNSEDKHVYGKLCEIRELLEELDL